MMISKFPVFNILIQIDWLNPLIWTNYLNRLTNSVLIQFNLNNTKDVHKTFWLTFKNF